MGGAGGSVGLIPDVDEDLNQHERERVIELLLSQERVISLLYDKTFTLTSMGEGGGAVGGANPGSNPMGVAEDIEAMKRHHGAMGSATSEGKSPESGIHHE